MPKMKSSLKTHLLFALVFIAICLVCIVAGLLLSTHDEGTVLIYRNGALFGSFSTNKNCNIDVEGLLTVVIDNGEVYVRNAHCNDKLCEKQGALTSFPIVCLPQRIEIRSASAQQEIDGVVY